MSDPFTISNKLTNQLPIQPPWMSEIDGATSPRIPCCSAYCFYTPGNQLQHHLPKVRTRSYVHWALDSVSIPCVFPFSPGIGSWDLISLIHIYLDTSVYIYIYILCIHLTYTLHTPYISLHHLTMCDVECCCLSYIFVWHSWIDCNDSPEMKPTIFWTFQVNPGSIQGWFKIHPLTQLIPSSSYPWYPEHIWIHHLFSHNTINQTPSPTFWRLMNE